MIEYISCQKKTKSSYFFFFYQFYSLKCKKNCKKTDGHWKNQKGAWKIKKAPSENTVRHAQD